MKLTFAAPWPVPIGVLAAIVTVVLVVLAHRVLSGSIDRRTRLVLLAVRLGAALLLVALLLEPVLVREHLKTKDLSVVVLVDRSESMRIPDSWGGRPRHRVAGDLLSTPGDGLIPLLVEEFNVVLLAFDRDVRAAGDGDLGPDVPPAGVLSDLAGAIRGAGKAAPRAETVAIVILTDGAENAGGDAVDAARETGVPVFAVGLGSGVEAHETRRDIAILGVEAPETAFAENTIVCEVSVHSTGYDLSDPGNRRVRVIVREGEADIASEWVEFTENGVPVRVPLRFVPAGTGTHTYHAVIALRGDEAVPGNNRRTFSVNVADRRASVLYYDATMRWEAKFLRDFLARDPAVDLTSVLHSGQGRLLVQGDTHGADITKGLPATAEGFEKFDVVILGDVAAEAMPREMLEGLRARVEAGGGLLIIGGYNALGAGGYGETPLAEALPVFVAKGDGQRESDVTLILTPEGRVHPVLSGLERDFSKAERPGLKGMNRVRREKPGAQVLLRGEAADGEGTGIVLAVHRYGEGRAAAFSGDTAWVWYGSAALGGPDGVYRRFWGQILRWLLEKDPEVEQAGEAVVLFTDRPTYRLGEVARIRARVRDTEGAPIKDASLSARLDGPEGAIDLELAPLARVPGHYEARHRAMIPGGYRVTAKAARAGASLGSAEAAFTVEETSVEMDSIDLDAARLESVAHVTGGRYYSSPEASRIAADIRGSLVGMAERQELSLTNTPLFFLMFVALMSLEWFLRRRRNLI